MNTQKNEKVFRPVSTVVQYNLINPSRPIPQIVEQTSTVIHTRDDHRNVQQSTIAIKELSQPPLLNLLDTHIPASSSQGLFNSAFSDAQQMIDHAPTKADGYVRMSSVLSMAGYHIRVIETCDAALQLTDLSSDQRSLLSATKSIAMDMLHRRVDIITALPFEIAVSIIALLPNTKDTLAACLTVSKSWRERTGGCASMWQSLSVDNGSTPADIIIANSVPYVAQHVRHLTLSTKDKLFRFNCLDAMRNGYFRKIESLKITGYAARNLQHVLEPLFYAYLKTSSSLTHIEIDQRTSLYPVSLAQILECCRTLKSLTFETAQKMTKMLGDFAVISRIHPLQNLELQSEFITANNIECIFTRCKRLRRLVMNTCESGILGCVARRAPSCLEILGYNIRYDTQVSALNDDESTTPGLREFYTDSSDDDNATMTQFIHIFMDTLKVVHVNCDPPLKNEAFYRIDSSHIPTLQLKNLTHLTLRLNSLLEAPVLNAISGATPLMYLALSSDFNISPLFLTTFMGLPPPRKLRISWFRNDTPELMQLFTHYAKVSTSASNAYLRSIIIGYHRSLLDDTLISLAEIQTLQEVSLSGLSKPNLTPRGLNSFIEKCGMQLTYIRICGVDALNGDVVNTIGKHSVKLARLELEMSWSLRDQNIQLLVDKRNKALVHLAVRNCPMVSAASIRYARLNIRTVEYVS